MSTKNPMMAIAINKSLLKEYRSSYCDRSVYLSDGQEFQIKLFNPTKHRIAAKVYINDEYLGNELIIRPGEIVWLERYLDVARKFKFETYEIDPSESGVREAIKHNGEIRVEFYKEKQRTKPIQFIESPVWSEIDGFGDVQINDIYNTTSKATDLTCCTYSTSCSTIDWVEPKETGRVTEGNQSSQMFREIDIDLEEYPFNGEMIRIMPMSSKPYTKNDLEKVYCYECGRKIKPKFKYCPFCGAKQ